jgi:hypothetical protein
LIVCERHHSIFVKVVDWISSRENHLPVFLSAFILTVQSIPAFASGKTNHWNVQVIGSTGAAGATAAATGSVAPDPEPMGTTGGSPAC